MKLILLNIKMLTLCSILLSHFIAPDAQATQRIYFCRKITPLDDAGVHARWGQPWEIYRNSAITPSLMRKEVVQMPRRSTSQQLVEINAGRADVTFGDDLATVLFPKARISLYKNFTDRLTSIPSFTGSQPIEVFTESSPEDRRIGNASASKITGLTIPTAVEFVELESSVLFIRGAYGLFISTHKLNKQIGSQSDSWLLMSACRSIDESNINFYNVEETFGPLIRAAEQLISVNPRLLTGANTVDGTSAISAVGNLLKSTISDVRVQLTIATTAIVSRAIVMRLNHAALASPSGHVRLAAVSGSIMISALADWVTVWDKFLGRQIKMRYAIPAHAKFDLTTLQQLAQMNEADRTARLTSDADLLEYVILVEAAIAQQKAELNPVPEA